MLHTSVFAGDSAATHVLLKGGISPSQTAKSGKTALEVAVRSIKASLKSYGLTSQPVSPHKFQIIALLIKAGADINQRLGPSGSTLLHKAVELRCAEHIGWLLSHGANPEIRDAEQRTAMDLACAANRQAAILALRAQVNIPITSRPVVAYPVTVDRLHPGTFSLPLGGHAPGVGPTTMLAQTTSVQPAATPAMNLLLAAALGHLSDLKELRAASGADINRQDQQGFTPLMYAILNGHLETALYLMSSGANPYIVAPGTRWSAFTIAAMTGQTDIMAALIRNPGFSDLKDIAGVEAMCKAVEFQQVAVILQLRQAGVSPYTPGPTGKSAALANLMSPAGALNSELQRALL